MRKLTLVMAATAAMAVPLIASAGPAAAEERHCYTPHVAGFDTVEVCTFLPIEPTS